MSIADKVFYKEGNFLIKFFYQRFCPVIGIYNTLPTADENEVLPPLAQENEAFYQSTSDNEFIQYNLSQFRRKTLTSDLTLNSTKQYIIFLFSLDAMDSCPEGYKCSDYTYASVGKCWENPYKEKFFFFPIARKGYGVNLSATRIVIEGGANRSSVEIYMICNERGKPMISVLLAPQLKPQIIGCIS